LALGRGRGTGRGEAGIDEGIVVDCLRFAEETGFGMIFLSAGIVMGTPRDAAGWVAMICRVLLRCSALSLTRAYLAS